MVRFDIVADKTALLVIDMQNAFLQLGSPAERPSGRDLIPRLNQLIRACHEKKIKVIFTLHVFRADGSDVGLFKEFLPDPVIRALTEGTSSIDIYPEVEQQKGDIMVTKAVYNAFWGTELDHILRINGIDTLIIFGLDTLLCCESTTREARHRNYKVIFLSDGTGTSDQPDMGWGVMSADQAQSFALTVIALRFAEVLSVEELLKRIQALD